MGFARYFLISLALVIGFSVGGTGSSAQPLPDRKLIVGTKEAPPFAIKTGDGDWTGVSMDLWRQIASALNLQYEFRELTLRELFDGVADGSLDAAVAALTITEERERILDFTHPFHTTGLGIATTAKQGAPWLNVLKRFLSFAFLKVVLSLAALLLGIGVLVWWFERKRNPDQFGDGAMKGVGSGFWWSAVTMTTVGYGDKAPVTLGGRMTALIWMFVAIIIISSFTAAITSSLTVTQLQSPVEGPEDLPKVRVGAIPETTSAAYLKEQHISFEAYNTPLEGLTAIAGERIDAFVHDAPILRYLVNQDFHGNLQVLPRTFVRQDYGIALPTGSSLREPMNRVLLKTIADPKWQDVLKRYLGQ